MIQMLKNRYLDSFLKFFLISAIIHIVILLFITIKERDIVYLNYFHILNINLFFKGVEVGILSQVISIVLMVIIYIIIFLFFTRKK